MSVKLIYVIFGGIVLSLVDNARILSRVKRQSLKVRITAKDDSIVLQYLSSIPVIKLQGYILGLGGRFSKQNITLPGNGDPIEVDVDFNPKYLVAVHPVAEQNNAALGKKCKGSPDLHKPPRIAIDPRTPTSVLLTWAHSFKDKGFKVGKECENERQYTIRYREKERDKKWKYHLCPSSETTIDDLKPNTVYEFGIRVTKAKKDGVWSKPTTYTTTMTPQPRSSKNDQNKMKLNKVEVNFNSENPKHPRKPEPPGMTNIKGITATKKIAPNSAHNRTNWKLLPPKKPELSTKAIVGSQSTSNSADIQPGKSSSPKPVITSKPEHANDFDKEGKKEETTNIVSKPSMKGSKTRKENRKPAMKPLTTKGSKLSSSASPSFSSKPLLNSDRTEPETPSSTIMPFITLRTTSDPKDVGNQDLPEIELPSSSNTFVSTSDTTSALDSMETKTFSEPEMPATSSLLFDPISEPDDMDTQKFPEPKIRSFSISPVIPIPESVSMDVERFTEHPSSISSFSTSSNMVSKPDIMNTKWFTEHEEPSSRDAFYINSPTTLAPDNVDNKQFTEHVVESTTNSLFTTSNTIYESDSPQRKQISVPEFEEPFLSIPPVNTLKSSKNDEMEPRQSEEADVSPFTTSKVFITSSPTTDADVKGQQSFAVSTSDSPNVFTLMSDYELVASDSSPVFIPLTQTTDSDPADYEVPTYDINNVFTLMADHEFPVTDMPNVIYPIPELESAKIRETDTTDDMSTFRTPKVITLMSGSKLPAPDSSYMFNPVTQSERPKVTVNTMPSSNTPNLFRLISGYKPQATKPPNLSKMVPESEPANIRVTDIAGHMEPTTDTPSMFRTISGSKPQDIDTTNEFSLITESVPAKMRVTEDTDDLELSTSHTSKVFTLMSGYELQATDTPNVINPIPEPNPTMIGEAEVTDIKVPVTDISNVPIMLPESDTAKIEDTEVADHVVPTSDTANVFTFPLNNELLVTDVINPIPEPQQTKISNTEVADFELPVSKILNVFDPNPKSEATRISYTEVTDNVVSTSCTPKVLALIPDHDLLITGTPNVINPIPETERAKIRDTEVAVHEVSTSDVFNLIPDSDPPATDIPNNINPTPKSEEIGDIKVTDDEVPNSDFPAVVTLLPDHELPITDTPNMINPIPEPERANIKDTEVTDHLVLHSPNVVTLTPDHELIVTDTSNVINPITETEHVKLRDTEIADRRVKISDAANVFSLIPVGELPATDIPNVTNPIPKPEHAKIRDTEVTDHEPSTIKTTKLSDPTHAYSTREKKLTDHKLPTSDTFHVFIPTLVSELDHIEDKTFTDHELTNSDASNAFSQAPISENSDTEDQEFKAPKATNSETSRMFSSTPRSEFDNKEDKEIRDYKLPIHGSPNVFSQSHESAHDNTDVKDLADYGLSSSDTPNVFQSTPVSQLGNTEEKDLSESDSPSDSSPIITSNPMPETDAKVDHTGPETLSTVNQLSSTISGRTPEKPPVFRSTPVSNIDGQGQERFRGPYMKYMSKRKIPCSITESLKHFPEENITNAKALTAPRYPPSNLTLVTVEGCPTFLIVDWMNNENDTASEYEVISEMEGPDNKTEKLITLTNQTHAAVENLKPNTSYTFSVTPTNVHGRGPSSDPLPFVTESADPSVSEYIPGKDAIWTQYSFKFDSYSECQGKRFVKRTRYRKFVGIVLCNSLRYKIYLSNSLSGIFYNIGDLSGHGEDHCQFVDSFLDGRTGELLLPEQLPIRQGFYRSVRQEPVMFGTIGGQTHINYVHWYECGIAIPGQW